MAKETINTLSFKGILKVKDIEEAKTAVLALLNLGFSFENNTAYVSHTHCHYGTTTTLIDTAELTKELLIKS